MDSVPEDENSRQRRRPKRAIPHSYDRYRIRKMLLRHYRNGDRFIQSLAAIAHSHKRAVRAYDQIANYIATDQDRDLYKDELDDPTAVDDYIRALRRMMTRWSRDQLCSAEEVHSGCIQALDSPIAARPLIQDIRAAIAYDSPTELQVRPSVCLESTWFATRESCHTDFR